MDRHYCKPSLFALATALLPLTPAHAQQTYQQAVTFSTANQSMWGFDPLNGKAFDYTFKLILQLEI